MSTGRAGLWSGSTNGRAANWSRLGLSARFPVLIWSWKREKRVAIENWALNSTYMDGAKRFENVSKDASEHKWMARKKVRFAANNSAIFLLSAEL